MLFKTHLLLGIIFFLAFNHYFSGGNLIFFFLLVLLGSIIPDIDERHSKVNQWSGFLGRIVTLFFGHRGLFHSLLFAVLISGGVWVYYGWYYAGALLLGYIAHLAGDALTPMGVQVFYPFYGFKMRGPMRVGGFLEGILFLILAALILRLVI